MPKDRYVCAPMSGHGHREAAKVEFDSRRAVARLTAVFCGTSSGGGKGASRPHATPGARSRPPPRPSDTCGVSESRNQTHALCFKAAGRACEAASTSATIRRRGGSSGAASATTSAGPWPARWAACPRTAALERCGGALRARRPRRGHRRGSARRSKEPDALSPDDLAPVDHSHTRGKEATLELARLAGIAPGARVVDVGAASAAPRGCWRPRTEHRP
jgi:hypothetical protein